MLVVVSFLSSVFFLLFFGWGLCDGEEANGRHGGKGWFSFFYGMRERGHSWTV
jgi:hypothetical protein